jgi:hypothetical protein
MPESRAAAPTCGSPGALISRGHKLCVARPWFLGSKAGVIVDEKNGVLSGAPVARAPACQRKTCSDDFLFLPPARDFVCLMHRFSVRLVIITVRL